MINNKNLRKETLSVASLPKSGEIRTTKLLEYANGIYQGQMSGTPALKNGLGVFAFDNGDFFFGEWENDSIEGEGILFFAFGGFVHGFFSKNQLEGPAFLKFSNGEVYEGFWQNGKLHGEAYNYFVDEAIWLKCSYFEGQFDSLLSEGTGRAPSNILNYLSDARALSQKHKTSENPRIKVLDFSDGQQFLGAAYRNKTCGLGLLRKLDGKCDIGFSDNGKFVDIGRINLVDGGIYDGLLKKGNFHGRGLQYNMNDKSWFYGSFENGECIKVSKQGQGKYPQDIIAQIRAKHHQKSNRFVSQVVAEKLFCVPSGYTQKQTTQNTEWQPQTIERRREKVFSAAKSPQLIRSVYIHEQVYKDINDSSVGQKKHKKTASNQGISNSLVSSISPDSMLYSHFLKKNNTTLTEHSKNLNATASPNQIMKNQKKFINQQGFQRPPQAYNLLNSSNLRSSQESNNGSMALPQTWQHPPRGRARQPQASSLVESSSGIKENKAPKSFSSPQKQNGDSVSDISREPSNSFIKISDPQKTDKQTTSNLEQAAFKQELRKRSAASNSNQSPSKQQTEFSPPTFKAQEEEIQNNQRETFSNSTEPQNSFNRQQPNNLRNNEDYNQIGESQRRQLLLGKSASSHQTQEVSQTGQNRNLNQGHLSTEQLTVHSGQQNNQQQQQLKQQSSQYQNSLGTRSPLQNSYISGSRLEDNTRMLVDQSILENTSGPFLQKFQEVIAHDESVEEYNDMVNGRNEIILNNILEIQQQGANPSYTAVSKRDDLINFQTSIIGIQDNYIQRAKRLSQSMNSRIFSSAGRATLSHPFLNNSLQAQVQSFQSSPQKRILRSISQPNYQGILSPEGERQEQIIFTDQQQPQQAYPRDEPYRLEQQLQQGSSQLKQNMEMQQDGQRIGQANQSNGRGNILPGQLLTPQQALQDSTTASVLTFNGQQRKPQQLPFVQSQYINQPEQQTQQNYQQDQSPRQQQGQQFQYVSEIQRGENDPNQQRDISRNSPFRREADSLDQDQQSQPQTQRNIINFRQVDSFFTSTCDTPVNQQTAQQQQQQQHPRNQQRTKLAQSLLLDEQQRYLEQQGYINNPLQNKPDESMGIESNWDSSIILKGNRDPSAFARAAQSMITDGITSEQQILNDLSGIKEKGEFPSPPPKSEFYQQQQKYIHNPAQMLESSNSELSQSNLIYTPSPENNNRKSVSDSQVNQSQIQDSRKSQYLKQQQQEIAQMEKEQSSSSSQSVIQKQESSQQQAYEDNEEESKQINPERRGNTSFESGELKTDREGNLSYRALNSDKDRLPTFSELKHHSSKDIEHQSQVQSLYPTDNELSQKANQHQNRGMQHPPSKLTLLQSQASLSQSQNAGAFPQDINQESSIGLGESQEQQLDQTNLSQTNQNHQNNQEKQGQSMRQNQRQDSQLQQSQQQQMQTKNTDQQNRQQKDTEQSENSSQNELRQNPPFSSQVTQQIVSPHTAQFNQQNNDLENSLKLNNSQVSREINNSNLNINRSAQGEASSQRMVSPTGNQQIDLRQTISPQRQGDTTQQSGQLNNQKNKQHQEYSNAQQSQQQDSNQQDIPLNQESSQEAISRQGTMTPQNNTDLKQSNNLIDSPRRTDSPLHQSQDKINRIVNTGVRNSQEIISQNLENMRQSIHSQSPSRSQQVSETKGNIISPSPSSSPTSRVINQDKTNLRKSNYSPEKDPNSQGGNQISQSFQTSSDYKQLQDQGQPGYFTQDKDTSKGKGSPDNTSQHTLQENPEIVSGQVSNDNQLGRRTQFKESVEGDSSQIDQMNRQNNQLSQQSQIVGQEGKNQSEAERAQQSYSQHSLGIGISQNQSQFTNPNLSSQQIREQQTRRVDQSGYQSPTKKIDQSRQTSITPRQQDKQQGSETVLLSNQDNLFISEYDQQQQQQQQQQQIQSVFEEEQEQYKQEDQTIDKQKLNRLEGDQSEEDLLKHSAPQNKPKEVAEDSSNIIQNDGRQQFQEVKPQQEGINLKSQIINVQNGQNIVVSNIPQQQGQQIVASQGLNEDTDSTQRKDNQQIANQHEQQDNKRSNQIINSSAHISQEQSKHLGQQEFNPSEQSITRQEGTISQTIQNQSFRGEGQQIIQNQRQEEIQSNQQDPSVQFNQQRIHPQAQQNVTKINEIINKGDTNQQSQYQPNQENKGNIEYQKTKSPQQDNLLPQREGQQQFSSNDSSKGTTLKSSSQQQFQQRNTFRQDEFNQQEDLSSQERQNTNQNGGTGQNEGDEPSNEVIKGSFDQPSTQASNEASRTGQQKNNSTIQISYQQQDGSNSIQDLNQGTIPRDNQETIYETEQNEGGSQSRQQVPQQQVQQTNQSKDDQRQSVISQQEITSLKLSQQQKNSKGDQSNNAAELSQSRQQNVDNSNVFVGNQETRQKTQQIQSNPNQKSNVHAPLTQQLVDQDDYGIIQVKESNLEQHNNTQLPTQVNQGENQAQLNVSVKGSYQQPQQEQQQSQYQEKYSQSKGIKQSGNTIQEGGKLQTQQEEALNLKWDEQEHRQIESQPNVSSGQGRFVIEKEGYSAIKVEEAESIDDQLTLNQQSQRKKQEEVPLQQNQDISQNRLSQNITATASQGFPQVQLNEQITTKESIVSTQITQQQVRGDQLAQQQQQGTISQSSEDSKLRIHQGLVQQQDQPLSSTEKQEEMQDLKVTNQSRDNSKQLTTSDQGNQYQQQQQSIPANQTVIPSQTKDSFQSNEQDRRQQLSELDKTKQNNSYDNEQEQQQNDQTLKILPSTTQQQQQKGITQQINLNDAQFSQEQRAIRVSQSQAHQIDVQSTDFRQDSINHQQVEDGTKTEEKQTNNQSDQQQLQKQMATNQGEQLLTGQGQGNQGQQLSTQITQQSTRQTQDQQHKRMQIKQREGGDGDGGDDSDSDKDEDFQKKQENYHDDDDDNNDDDDDDDDDDNQRKQSKQNKQYSKEGQNKGAEENDRVTNKIGQKLPQLGQQTQIQTKSYDQDSVSGQQPQEFIEQKDLIDNNNKQNSQQYPSRAYEQSTSQNILPQNQNTNQKQSMQQTNDQMKANNNQLLQEETAAIISQAPNNSQQEQNATFQPNQLRQYQQYEDQTQNQEDQISQQEKISRMRDQKKQMEQNVSQNQEITQPNQQGQRLIAAQQQTLMVDNSIDHQEAREEQEQKQKVIQFNPEDQLFSIGEQQDTTTQFKTNDSNKNQIQELKYTLNEQGTLDHKDNQLQFNQQGSEEQQNARQQKYSESRQNTFENKSQQDKHIQQFITNLNDPRQSVSATSKQQILSTSSQNPNNRQQDSIQLAQQNEQGYQIRKQESLVQTQANKYGYQSFQKQLIQGQINDVSQISSQQNNSGKIEAIQELRDQGQGSSNSGDPSENQYLEITQAGNQFSPENTQFTSTERTNQLLEEQQSSLSKELRDLKYPQAQSDQMTGQKQQSLPYEASKTQFQKDISVVEYPSHEAYQQSQQRQQQNQGSIYHSSSSNQPQGNQIFNRNQDQGQTKLSEQQISSQVSNQINNDSSQTINQQARNTSSEGQYDNESPDSQYQLKDPQIQLNQQQQSSLKREQQQTNLSQIQNPQSPTTAREMIQNQSIYQQQQYPQNTQTDNRQAILSSSSQRFQDGNISQNQDQFKIQQQQVISPNSTFSHQGINATLETQQQSNDTLEQGTQLLRQQEQAFILNQQTYPNQITQSFQEKQLINVSSSNQQPQGILIKNPINSTEEQLNEQIQQSNNQNQWQNQQQNIISPSSKQSQEKFYSPSVINQQQPSDNVNEQQQPGVIYQAGSKNTKQGQQNILISPQSANSSKLLDLSVPTGISSPQYQSTIPFSGQISSTKQNQNISDSLTQDKDSVKKQSHHEVDRQTAKGPLELSQQQGIQSQADQQQYYSVDIPQRDQQIITGNQAQIQDINTNQQQRQQLFQKQSEGSLFSPQNTFNQSQFNQNQDNANDQAYERQKQNISRDQFSRNTASNYTQIIPASEAGNSNEIIQANLQNLRNSLSPGGRSSPYHKNYSQQAQTGQGQFSIKPIILPGGESESVQSTLQPGQSITQTLSPKLAKYSSQIIQQNLNELRKSGTPINQIPQEREPRQGSQSPFKGSQSQGENNQSSFIGSPVKSVSPIRTSNTTVILEQTLSPSMAKNSAQIIQQNLHDLRQSSQAITPIKQQGTVESQQKQRDFNEQQEYSIDQSGQQFRQYVNEDISGQGEKVQGNVINNQQQIPQYEASQKKISEVAGIQQINQSTMINQSKEVINIVDQQEQQESQKRKQEYSTQQANQTENKKGQLQLNQEKPVSQEYQYENKTQSQQQSNITNNNTQPQLPPKQDQKKPSSRRGSDSKQNESLERIPLEEPGKIQRSSSRKNSAFMNKKLLDFFSPKNVQDQQQQSSQVRTSQFVTSQNQIPRESLSRQSSQEKRQISSDKDVFKQQTTQEALIDQQKQRGADEMNKNQIRGDNSNTPSQYYQAAQSSDIIGNTLIQPVSISQLNQSSQQQPLIRTTEQSKQNQGEPGQQSQTQQPFQENEYQKDWQEYLQKQQQQGQIEQKQLLIASSEQNQQLPVQSQKYQQQQQEHQKEQYFLNVQGQLEISPFKQSQQSQQTLNQRGNPIDSTNQLSSQIFNPQQEYFENKQNLPAPNTAPSQQFDSKRQPQAANTSQYQNYEQLAYQNQNSEKDKEKQTQRQFNTPEANQQVYNLNSKMQENNQSHLSQQREQGDTQQTVFSGQQQQQLLGQHLKPQTISQSQQSSYERQDTGMQHQKELDSSKLKQEYLTQDNQKMETDPNQFMQQYIRSSSKDPSISQSSQLYSPNKQLHPSNSEQLQNQNSSTIYDSNKNNNTNQIERQSSTKIKEGQNNPEFRQQKSQNIFEQPLVEASNQNKTDLNFQYAPSSYFQAQAQQTGTSQQQEEDAQTQAQTQLQQRGQSSMELKNPTAQQLPDQYISAGQIQYESFQEQKQQPVSKQSTYDHSQQQVEGTQNQNISVDYPNLYSANQTEGSLSTKDYHQQQLIKSKQLIPENQINQQSKQQQLARESQPQGREQYSNQQNIHIQDNYSPQGSKEQQNQIISQSQNIIPISAHKQPIDYEKQSQQNILGSQSQQATNQYLTQQQQQQKSVQSQVANSNQPADYLRTSQNYVISEPQLKSNEYFSGGEDQKSSDQQLQQQSSQSSKQYQSNENPSSFDINQQYPFQTSESQQQSNLSQFQQKDNQPLGAQQLEIVKIQPQLDSRQEQIQRQIVLDQSQQNYQEGAQQQIFQNQELQRQRENQKEQQSESNLFIKQQYPGREQQSNTQFQAANIFNQPLGVEIQKPRSLEFQEQLVSPLAQNQLQEGTSLPFSTLQQQNQPTKKQQSVDNYQQQQANNNYLSSEGNIQQVPSYLKQQADLEQLSQQQLYTSNLQSTFQQKPLSKENNLVSDGKQQYPQGQQQDKYESQISREYLLDYQGQQQQQTGEQLSQSQSAQLSKGSATNVQGLTTSQNQHFSQQSGEQTGLIEQIDKYSRDNVQDIGKQTGREQSISSTYNPNNSLQQQGTAPKLSPIQSTSANYIYQADNQSSQLIYPNQSGEGKDKTEQQNQGLQRISSYQPTKNNDSELTTMQLPQYQYTNQAIHDASNSLQIAAQNASRQINNNLQDAYKSSQAPTSSLDKEESTKKTGQSIRLSDIKQNISNQSAASIVRPNNMTSQEEITQKKQEAINSSSLNYPVVQNSQSLPRQSATQDGKTIFHSSQDDNTQIVSNTLNQQIPQRQDQKVLNQSESTNVLNNPFQSQSNFQPFSQEISSSHNLNPQNFEQTSTKQPTGQSYQGKYDINKTVSKQQYEQSIQQQKEQFSVNFESDLISNQTNQEAEYKGQIIKDSQQQQTLLNSQETRNQLNPQAQQNPSKRQEIILNSGLNQQKHLDSSQFQDFKQNQQETQPNYIQSQNRGVSQGNERQNNQISQSEMMKNSQINTKIDELIASHVNNKYPERSLADNRISPNDVQGQPIGSKEATNQNNKSSDPSFNTNDNQTINQSVEQSFLQNRANKATTGKQIESLTSPNEINNNSQGYLQPQKYLSFASPKGTQSQEQQIGYSRSYSQLDNSTKKEDITQNPEGNSASKQATFISPSRFVLGSRTGFIPTSPEAYQVQPSVHQQCLPGVYQQILRNAKLSQSGLNNVQDNSQSSVLSASQLERQQQSTQIQDGSKSQQPITQYNQKEQGVQSIKDINLIKDSSQSQSEGSNLKRQQEYLQKDSQLSVSKSDKTNQDVNSNIGTAKIGQNSQMQQLSSGNQAIFQNQFNSAPATSSNPQINSSQYQGKEGNAQNQAYYSQVPGNSLSTHSQSQPIYLTQSSQEAQKLLQSQMTQQVSLSQQTSVLTTEKQQFQKSGQSSDYYQPQAGVAHENQKDDSKQKEAQSTTQITYPQGLSSTNPNQEKLEQFITSRILSNQVQGLDSFNESSPTKDRRYSPKNSPINISQNRSHSVPQSNNLGLAQNNTQIQALNSNAQRTITGSEVNQQQVEGQYQRNSNTYQIGSSQQVPQRSSSVQISPFRSIAQTILANNGLVPQISSDQQQTILARTGQLESFNEGQDLSRPSFDSFIQKQPFSSHNNTKQPSSLLSDKITDNKSISKEEIYDVTQTAQMETNPNRVAENRQGQQASQASILPNQKYSTDANSMPSSFKQPTFQPADQKYDSSNLLLSNSKNTSSQLPSNDYSERQYRQQDNLVSGQEDIQKNKNVLPSQDITSNNLNVQKEGSQFNYEFKDYSQLITQNQQQTHLNNLRQDDKSNNSQIIASQQPNQNLKQQLIQQSLTQITQITQNQQHIPSSTPLQQSSTSQPRSPSLPQGQIISIGIQSPQLTSNKNFEKRVESDVKSQETNNKSRQRDFSSPLPAALKDNNYLSSSSKKTNEQLEKNALMQGKIKVEGVSDHSSQSSDNAAAIISRSRQFEESSSHKKGALINRQSYNEAGEKMLSSQDSNHQAATPIHTAQFNSITESDEISEISKQEGYQRQQMLNSNDPTNQQYSSLNPYEQSNKDQGNQDNIKRNINVIAQNNQYFSLSKPQPQQEQNNEQSGINKFSLVQPSVQGDKSTKDGLNNYQTFAPGLQEKYGNPLLGNNQSSEIHTGFSSPKIDNNSTNNYNSQSNAPLAIGQQISATPYQASSQSSAPNQRIPQLLNGGVKQQSEVQQDNASNNRQSQVEQRTNVLDLIKDNKMPLNSYESPQKLNITGKTISQETQEMLNYSSAVRNQGRTSPLASSSQQLSDSYRGERQDRSLSIPIKDRMENIKSIENKIKKLSESILSAVNDSQSKIRSGDVNYDSIEEERDQAGRANQYSSDRKGYLQRQQSPVSSFMQTPKQLRQQQLNQSQQSIRTSQDQQSPSRPPLQYKINPPNQKYQQQSQPYLLNQTQSPQTDLLQQNNSNYQHKDSTQKQSQSSGDQWKLSQQPQIDSILENNKQILQGQRTVHQPSSHTAGDQDDRRTRMTSVLSQQINYSETANSQFLYQQSPNVSLIQGDRYNQQQGVQSRNVQTALASPYSLSQDPRSQSLPHQLSQQQSIQIISNTQTNQDKPQSQARSLSEQMYQQQYQQQPTQQQLIQNPQSYNSSLHPSPIKIVQSSTTSPYKQQQYVQGIQSYSIQQTPPSSGYSLGNQIQQQSNVRQLGSPFQSNTPQQTLAPFTQRSNQVITSQIHNTPGKQTETKIVYVSSSPQIIQPHQPRSVSANQILQQSSNSGIQQQQSNMQTSSTQGNLSYSSPNPFGRNSSSVSPLPQSRRQVLASPGQQTILQSSSVTQSPDPRGNQLSLTQGASPQIQKTPLQFITFQTPQKQYAQQRREMSLPVSPEEIQRVPLSQKRSSSNKGCFSMCCKTDTDDGEIEVEVNRQNLMTLQQIKIQQQQQQQQAQGGQQEAAGQESECAIF